MLRLRHNYSQQELADASGLSRNTLSLIERGRTSPTIATLKKIADALKIDISTFFQTNLRANILDELGATSSSPIPINTSSDGVDCRIDRLLSARILRLDSGANSGLLSSHHGEELVYCLKGKCEYSIDDKSYLLEPGDSLLFNGEQPHSCKNPGQKPAEALVILLDMI